MKARTPFSSRREASILRAAVHRSGRFNRRDTLKLFGAAGAGLLLGGCGGEAMNGAQSARVVVVGGGFGGATAAKYIKRLNPEIHVTLIEPAQRFYTCPFSNLYLAGWRDFESLGHDFDTLRSRYGVEVVHQLAEDVDAQAHTVRLADGTELPYDKLVLSPGIDIRWDALEGYDEAAAERAPHAWKAGEQTRLLRSQLEAMEDGGTFVLVAPANPFRCPPGPYERVSVVAHYLSTEKPNSKVLVLDSKDAFSKQPLFQQGWRELYGDRVEWVGLSGDGRVVRVDAANLEVESEFGEIHRADVLNVVPPQKAGFIADRAGVTDDSGWVPVEPRTFEAMQAEDIYVVGDATVAAPMPKSAFNANAQAKYVAFALVAALADREPPEPLWNNTCYSLLAPDYGISVAGVYRLENGAIVEAPGGGISPLDADAQFRQLEAGYAAGWYQAISQDTWGAES